MNDFFNQLQNLDQEQAIVAVFAGVLIFSVVLLGAVAAVRSLGKWGTVAVALGSAAVLIAYRVNG
jgi:hypothetical protein